MIKKFTFVFLLTLVSQIISLFSISYVVKRNATDSFIEFVALLDSSYLLINTILSFGIIQIATREIVVVEKWRKIVEHTQNTRINFSYVLFIVGLIIYLITKNHYFLVFLMSPLVALNVNYVFYAKGKPQVATTNASIRLFILSFSLVFLGTFQYFSNEIYFLFFILGLLYVAFVSNSVSKTRVNFKINPFFLKEYSKSVGVGLADLAIIFLEFGILFFATFFYRDTIVAEAYILIKIITLVKGFQRMIFQVFYDQLIEKEKTLFLDQIILFSGFSFFSLTFFFSKEIMILLYSKNDLILQNNFVLFSLALLIASIILASMARTLIIKNDKTYIRSYLLSFVFSFVTMIVLSYSKIDNYGISISLIVGELVLFLSFFIGIYKEIFVKKYILVLLKFGILFISYFLISKIFKEQVLFIIIIFSQLFIVAFFLFQNKKNSNK